MCDDWCLSCESFQVGLTYNSENKFRVNRLPSLQLVSNNSKHEKFDFLQLIAHY